MQMCCLETRWYVIVLCYKKLRHMFHHCFSICSQFVTRHDRWVCKVTTETKSHHKWYVKLQQIVDVPPLFLDLQPIRCKCTRRTVALLKLLVHLQSFVCKLKWFSVVAVSLFAGIPVLFLVPRHHNMGAYFSSYFTTS